MVKEKGKEGRIAGWFNKKFRSSLAINPLMPMIGILPAIICLVIFSLSPAVLNFVLTFTNYKSASIPFEFVWFENYKNLFTIVGVEIFDAFLTTFKYALLTVPFNTALALFAAVLVAKEIRGKNLFRAIFFMPIILGSVVVCFSWTLILDTAWGPMIKLLNLVGIDSAILGNPKTSLLWVSIITIWGNFGYLMVIFIAGIHGINKEYYEAAAIDGAGEWKCFTRITLPLLKPTLFICLWITISGSLGMTDYILLTTNGGYGTETIGFYILRMVLYGSMSQGMNATIIIFNFVIVTAIMLTFNIISNRQEDM